jgi:type VI secretion system secreted protein VgrG
MARALTQNTRICELTTPLGKDVLVFTRLDASEALSELFEFRIDCLSEDADLNFDQAIGKQCSLRVTMLGQQREFSGILVEAQWLGAHNEYYSYRIVLRPWLWLLTRTTDCRIFQDKKAPDIIKEVFRERGFTDFESKLTEDSSCPKLEYCVQYRETDFDFVSRLMEQHGIYYFFKHDSGKHTLVLADSKSSHTPVDGLASIPFIPLSGSDRRSEQNIHHWIAERRFRTGKVELNDYNYEKPNAKMTSDAKGSESYTRSEMEFYDYPGKYKEKSDGERYAKIHLESEQALDHRRQASGSAISLFPGGLTRLNGHFKDSQNIEYLVVRCLHAFENEEYRSGSGGGSHDVYSGNYEFQQSDRPFRAPIVTPKPVINGIQTAKVVTKDSNSNEEIDVESLGEIYVRFFWDRKKMRSCCLRVAQVWSGKKWGGQVIPRVGQEVVVEFLEGDPDRPLVIGTVYNDEYKLPYDLPSKKTVSGLKSDSTKGGGGYNEWNFEDKKGSEQIGIHAQKDLDVVVLNAETRTIGEEFLAGDSRKTTLIKGNDKLDILTGSQQVTIAMNQTTQAGLSISNTAGMSIAETAGMSISETAGLSISETAGASITQTAGMAITLSAQTAITLQVGASMITLTQAGIVITAPTITMLSLGPLLAHGTPTVVG